MRATLQLVLTLLLIGFGGAVAYAQESGGTGAALSPAEEAEWVKIRELKKIYEDALQNNKLDSLAPYISESFTGTVLSGEQIVGLAGLKSYNQKTRELIGEGATYTLKVVHQPGWMSGDVAVAYGSTEETVVTSKNNRFEYPASWSAVLRKEGGVWKLVRLHISLDPVRNPFADFFAWKKYQLYLVGALVVGLLLGFCVRGVMPRRG